MSLFRKPAALAAASTLALLTAAAARAQDLPTPLSEVVVAATLTPTPRNQVGSSITLITGQEIEDHQWRTLPDALAQTPGLNLVQEGGPGGLTSVFIRGANANHTEVIIDGIDVNDPSQNGAFDFGQALASGVARIEVLRGPQSSLYGADALGGVISIETPEGEGHPRLALRLEGGSFDTFNQSAGLRGSAGRFHYAVDISHFRSGDTPVTPPGLLAPGTKAIGDRYDNVTAAGKFAYVATRDLSLGLVLRYVDGIYRSTGENFDLFPAVPDTVQTNQWKRQFFARAQATLELLGGRVETRFGGAYLNFHTTIQSPDDGFGLPAPIVDQGDRVKFDGLGTITLTPTETLVLGVDETIDRLIDSPVSAIERRAGGFAELQARPLPGLTVAASVRYDSDDRFGAATTWRIAPAYTIPGIGTVLKASIGTGFKAPTLSELFVSFPDFDFFANPDLRPETSTGYDAGFEQPVWGGRARFGATWFHNAIRGLIESCPDPAGGAFAETYCNIGKATIYGVESFVAVTPFPSLDLRADYTLTVARDDIAHQELLRRPRNKATLSANWRVTPRFRLAASLLYVGAEVDGNRDFSIRRLRASPYATVNLAGDYDLGHGLTLFGRIDNLLDRHYQQPVGFDRPGLGAYGGVRVALRP